MSAWFENDVHANGVRLHVHRTGMPGKPALLLLHGITDSGPVWRSVARELAGEYDIVMPDARGHGQSDDLARGFSLSLLAADVVAVIVSLGLQRPDLWGLSMCAVSAGNVSAVTPRRDRTGL